MPLNKVIKSMLASDVVQLIEGAVQKLGGVVFGKLTVGKYGAQNEIDIAGDDNSTATVNFLSGEDVVGYVGKGGTDSTMEIRAICGDLRAGADEGSILLAPEGGAALRVSADKEKNITLAVQGEGARLQTLSEIAILNPEDASAAAGIGWDGETPALRVEGTFDQFSIQGGDGATLFAALPDGNCAVGKSTLFFHGADGWGEDAGKPCVEADDDGLYLHMDQDNYIRQGDGDASVYLNGSKAMGIAGGAGTVLYTDTGDLTLQTTDAESRVFIKSANGVACVRPDTEGLEPSDYVPVSASAFTVATSHSGVKENVYAVPDALTGVLRVPVYEYNIIGEDARRRGIMIEDAPGVLVPDGGVDVYGMVATLWRAVQQLGAEVERIKGAEQ